MIIRLVFGQHLDFSEGLNRLRSQAYRRWWPAALAFSLVPGVLLAQIPPGNIGLQPSLPASTLQSPAVSTFNPSNPSGSVSAPAGYVLSANDQVSVEVFGEDDLRTNGRLNPEGNLSVPLLGSIHLAGLTLTQAASRLTELYGRDYLVSPKVNVMLLGYAKRRFSILGQVNRPGSYEMPESSPGGIDLLEAIPMAGGYTRIAATERIGCRILFKLIFFLWLIHPYLKR